VSKTFTNDASAAQQQLSEKQINGNGIKEGRRRREQEQPRNRNDLWTTQFARETCPPCRIAARQPSIRSKPQRMKRNLLQMLRIGETRRPCTRASECTPTHSLSSPPNHTTPPPPQNNTTQPPITTATQAPATASLNQRSKHSLFAFQHVSLRGNELHNAVRLPIHGGNKQR
jgi:hypothetical protein